MILLRIHQINRANTLACAFQFDQGHRIPLAFQIMPAHRILEKPVHDRTGMKFALGRQIVRFLPFLFRLRLEALYPLLDGHRVFRHIDHAHIFPFGQNARVQHRPDRPAVELRSGIASLQIAPDQLAEGCDFDRVVNLLAELRSRPLRFRFRAKLLRRSQGF